MVLPEEKSNYSLEDVQEMCTWWQRRFGLTDWAIQVRFKNMIDLNGEAMAQSHGNLGRRLGFIDISDPATRSNRSLPDDMEVSLVHEMLHIAFLAWHDLTGRISTVEADVCYEQPIDQLAETLVTLRRDSNHRFTFE